MKKVNLSEQAYNKLISEISYGKVQDASNASEHRFYDMEMIFWDFYDTVKYNPDVNNPYVKKIKEYADAISEILLAKSRQRKNFDTELNKFDYNKFYDDKDSPYGDYDKEDLRTMQREYPKDISNMRFDGRHMVQK